MSRSRDIADSTKTLDVDGGTIKLDGNYPVGTNNVALGDTALDAITTASNNTAIGFASLTTNVTGNQNTSVGGYSLYFNEASDNSAFGYNALFSNTTGANNTAVGTNSLSFNTTASNNTAVGYQAGYNNTTGERNVSLGFQAGNAATVNGYNTFLGTYAGLTTNSIRNTFIGEGSGYLVTTGSKNTILGRYNGNQDGLDIRTSNNNIVLSDGDGNPRLRIDAIGNIFFMPNPGVAPSSSQPGTLYQPAGGGLYPYFTNFVNDAVLRYHFEFGNSTGVTGRITTSGSSTSYGTSSDYRLKENVVAMTDATDRLKQLNPSRFNFIADADTTVDGFLAHEVQAVVPEAVTGTKDAVDEDGNPEYQGIDQSKLVPLLVATIQELEARITALEAN